MFISVIIPAYNTSENLKVLVGELLRQKESYPETQIIVVDDGSEEDMSWLNDLNGVIAIHQPNGGEASARNRGMKFAEGDYIAWVDADDMVVEHYLDILYENAAKGYDYVVFDWQFKNGIKGDRHPAPLINWNVWSYLFRRSMIQGKEFDERRLFACDYYWLEEVIKPEYSKLEAREVIVIYDDSYENSLTHRYQRGEIGLWR